MDVVEIQLLHLRHRPQRHQAHHVVAVASVMVYVQILAYAVVSMAIVISQLSIVELDVTLYLVRLQQRQDRLLH